MVQILESNKKPSVGQRLSGGIERGLEEGQNLMDKHKMKEQMKAENKAIKAQFGINLTDITDPKQRAAIVAEKLKGQRGEEKSKRTQAIIDRMTGNKGGQAQPDLNNNDDIKIESPQEEMKNQPSQDMQDEPNNEMPQKQNKGIDFGKIPEEEILALSNENPQLGKMLQDMKDSALEKIRHDDTEKRKTFKDDRAYHSAQSKDAKTEADSIRDSLQKKEMALDFSRSAIESGDVGAASWSNLAQRLGMKELQSAKGAQLELAAKEHLFGNLSRLSAKAQNVYMEQRMMSMLPQVGKTEWANLTQQEMLEADNAMDKAYLSEFDRIAEEDKKEHGFVLEDVKKRAHQSADTKNKAIMKRASFRVRQIEENEMGIKYIKKQVGKNVSKGTMLTPAMMKLYGDKFGKENGYNVAKKNGYYIPTKEEFAIFQNDPTSFREDLSNE